MILQNKFIAMKNTIVVSLFFLLSFQMCFSQQRDVKTIMKEAAKAFDNQDYETTLQKIEEIKIEFKKNAPPPSILSLEILTKSEIIKKDPLNNFASITEARNLTTKYLKNPNSKIDINFNKVVIEKNVFDNYPKDLATFNELKEAKIREEALIKEKADKAAAEEKARLERVALELKARQEQEAINKKAQLEADRIKNENAAIQAEKDRQAEAIAQVEREKNAQEYAERERIRQEKEAKAERRRLKSFSSLGIQSGEIAKYGLLYESGGRTFIGFHMSARTSLTPEEDILKGIAKANKTEIDLGPSFKIFKRLFLNLGVGYGYYNFINKNDYAGTSSIEKMGYIEASSGLMIRINRVISINGGASFMDIDKDFYKPEITFGISFNLKGNHSY